MTKPAKHTAIDISSNRKGPKVATSASVKKKPTELLAIRIREIVGVEGLALGFRQVMIESHDGSVMAGTGNPWIMLKWKDHQAAVNVQELLADWVRGWDAEAADMIEGADVSGGVGVTASQHEVSERGDNLDER